MSGAAKQVSTTDVSHPIPTGTNLKTKGGLPRTRARPLSVRSPKTPQTEDTHENQGAAPPPLWGASTPAGSVRKPYQLRGRLHCE